MSTDTAEVESAKEDEEARRFTQRLLRIGWGITGLFVAVFLGAAVWKDFLAGGINEMGDALAGFFSGLAFLWLVLTMQLQIKELEMQRKELRLGRIANEKQTTQLTETKEATQDELQLLRVNQAMLLEERVKRLEDEAARAALSHMVYSVIPSMERSAAVAAAAAKISDWQATLAAAATLSSANRPERGLPVIALLLERMEIHLDVPEALNELSALSGMRESLELLSTLITVFDLQHHAAKEYRRVQYYFGVRRVESSVAWLLEAAKSFPTAADTYKKQLQELQDSLGDSERVATELRKSAEENLRSDGEPRQR